MLDNVVMHGRLDDEALRRLYAKADLLFLPLVDGTANNALLEAMAMGLPVVSTNISGIPELIEPRVNGMLVPQKDAQALAAAIKELLDDAELRKRLSLAGRERVRRDFDARQNILALKVLFPGSAVLPGCGSCEEIAWK